MNVLTQLPDNWQAMDKVLLLHFVRQWSGSAMFTRTHVAAARERFGSQVIACEIDAEINPELMEAFRISEIPTLLVVSGGKVVGHFKGLFTQEKLDATIERVAVSSRDSLSTEKEFEVRNEHYESS